MVFRRSKNYKIEVNSYTEFQMICDLLLESGIRQAKTKNIVDFAPYVFFSKFSFRYGFQRELFKSNRGKAVSYERLVNLVKNQILYE